MLPTPFLSTPCVFPLPFFLILSFFQYPLPPPGQSVSISLINYSIKRPGSLTVCCQIVESTLMVQSVANPTPVFVFSEICSLVFLLLPQDPLLTSSALSMPAMLPFIWFSSTTACLIFFHSVLHFSFLSSLLDTLSWNNAIHISTTWANYN